MTNFVDLFAKNNGNPIEYKGRTLFMTAIYSFSSVPDRILLEFEHINGEMLQGLHLEIDRGSLLANGKDCGPDIVLWENTSPKKVEIWISGDPTELRVKNVFDTGLGIAQYWRDGAAMYAEENDGFIRYFCNDGEPDEDFDDLVFRMQVK